MTITPERQSHPPGRETGGGCDPCFGKRPHERLWHLCRGHAGGSVITEKSVQSAGGGPRFSAPWDNRREKRFRKASEENDKK